MLAIGLAYDLWLKRAGLGWACFALAFPLLPLSTWYIAAGMLPPRPGLLLPVAALPGRHSRLRMGSSTSERDASAGVPGIAVRLGRRRALAVLAMLLAVVYGLAILTLVFEPSRQSHESRSLLQRPSPRLDGGSHQGEARPSRARLADAGRGPGRW